MDETSSLQMEMGRKTTMVMMKNNQVGDDNTLTSARITTLFTELLGRDDIGVPLFTEATRT